MQEDRNNRGDIARLLIRSDLRGAIYHARAAEIHLNSGHEDAAEAAVGAAEAELTSVRHSLAGLRS